MNKLLYLLFTALVCINGYFLFSPKPTGSAIPQAISLFETSLVAPISSTDTSLTLASATVRNGSTLSGYTCFTIDEGTASAEDVCGTATGTSVTGLTRGIDSINGTSSVAALKFAHRRGADIKITDWPAIGILSRIANGQDSFPNLLSYANTIVVTAGSPTTTIPTLDYVNKAIVSGAVDASEGVKGIVDIATAAQARAGTSIGGTSARLMIPNSLATSSNDVAQTHSIISLATGFLKQNFLNLTEAFTFTGSLTNTGTTTLSKLVFGGVNYYAPSPVVASSSVLKSNVAGNLIWQPEDWQLLGEQTLDTTSATMTVSVLPRKYMRAVIEITGQNNDSDSTLRFNGNYLKYSVGFTKFDGATLSSSWTASTTGIALGSNYGTTTSLFFDISIMDLGASTAKIITGNGSSANGLGIKVDGSWKDLSTDITSITVDHLGVSTALYNAGSKLIIYGKND